MLAEAQAGAIGRGGIGVVSATAGMARSTVQRALNALSRAAFCTAALDLEVDGNLADALGEMGHKVSPDTVGRLLQAIGFSLQATAKQRET